MIFNRHLVNLIFEIRTKTSITRKTQTVYESSLGYFIAMRFLRKYNIIKEAGKTDDNLKIWTLTAKGYVLYEHLKSIRVLLEESNGKDTILS
jgi:predicted transcriptional regulator